MIWISYGFMLIFSLHSAVHPDIEGRQRYEGMRFIINSLIMKERKKIKYVQKQPPDKTVQPPNYREKQETGPRHQTSFPSTGEAKVENQQTNPQTYLVSENSNAEAQRYRNTRREEYRPKYAPKDPENPSQRTAERPPQQHREKQDRDMQAPRFVERQSSQQDHNCIICSQDIRRKDWIWTCSCCSISMHLRCIKQWIQNINEQQQHKAVYIFNWKCPQCNFEYNEPLPQYYCYCGKHKNPEIDRDLDPHSCGEICDKKRGINCPHFCPDICHRGKCRPCDYEGTVITCQCGKSQRTIKCSEERLAFQCGKKCEKVLTCQKHKCERNCHAGPCHPCKKKHMASCYCGKNEDIIDCASPSFSCPEVCGKQLNCGFHFCEENCHGGECSPCRKTPELQSTCPCGKYSIEMLTGDPEYRKSCQQIIPVCGMPCGKKLECGHGCPRSCHEGRCPQCKTMVEQLCYCGQISRKIECWKKSREQFRCETVCKKKRSCGQHLCNQVCCKFRTSPILDNHPCELSCTKMLNCQKHDCGQACHIGLCKKCPVIYSQPQPCPCGQTSLRPPIICGTLTPECNNICNKELACGHKCKNSCHYGPCKCYEDVVVACRCGKQQISTTCGRQALCLGKCQNMLECGHKCDLQCHRDTCEIAHKAQPCRKTCNKERSDCHHFCPQLCHPGQFCENFPCQAEILVKCECGHRQTMTLCGAKDHHKTRKAIVCNKKCENLKRFDIFYKDKEIYYPGAMVQFAFKNYVYLQNLQARLEKFILHSEQNFIEVQYKFPDSNNYKILLTNLFENHYHLNTHFYRYRKYATFTLMQSEDTMIPKPVLTEYVKLISKGIIKQTNLPFEFTVSFDCQVKQKMDLILKNMKNYIHKYYSERSNKVVSLHFWSKADGEDAIRYLENEYQTIEFKCSYNITKPEEEIGENQIIEEEMTEEEVKKENQEHKHELIHKEDVSPETISQVVVEKTENTESKPTKVEKGPGEVKRIPSSNQQGTTSKLIVRKGVPTFKKNDYPHSKQNVQDIYLIDQDELYNETIVWPQFVKKLCSTKMGPQASQWRIRSLLMVNSFNPVNEHVFHEEFNRLVALYNKDKQSAMRILQIQRIESKSVKSQMAENDIYLSDHEPEMLGYLQLYNYMAEEKIIIELPEIIEKTPEMEKTSEILTAVENKDVQLFYQHFSNSDYIYACALIPLVHYLRETILEQIGKGGRVPSKHLAKHLLFGSEEDFFKFALKNGLTIESRISKSTKEDIFFLKSGKLVKQHEKDEAFIQGLVFPKRDKKYFLVEPEELFNETYMTRSFFAFGDFKQSVSPKYMASLVKLLKEKE